MPLTPTDVANKQFRIAFRGYSLDEVDAFLDEVESELSRLLRDNSELKGRPAPAALAASAPAPVESLSGLEGQEAALRTLLLAQRTADEAIAEARAEAEQILAGARTEAETSLTSARHEAQSTLTSARSEAASTVGTARTEADRTLDAARREAETTLTAAQRKAANVEQEVATRVQAATGDLDERRRRLEGRIEELRAFEREYRTRLKAYLETQLRDLDGRTGSDDGGAGGRSANVGSPPAGAAGERSHVAGATGASTPGAVRPTPAPRSAPTPALAPPSTGAPSRPEPSAPDGPPREAPLSGLRAMPHLSATPEPEPVGPFTVDPRGRQADTGGEPPTSGQP